MGRGTNQIATWRDLRDGLGYRLPYGTDSMTNEFGSVYLDKAITYYDLTHCQKGYLPEFYSEYASLSADAKLAYVTNNAELDTIYGLSGINISLQGHEDVNAYSSSDSTLLLFTNDDTTSQHVTWYTFIAPKSTAQTTVIWNNLELYATTKGNFTQFIGWIYIKKSTIDGDTVGRGSFVINTVGDKQKIDISGLDVIDTLEAGCTYYIVISVNCMGVGGIISGGILLNHASVKFYRSDSDAYGTFSQDSYSWNGYKCVRYDQLKANYNTTVPISCTIYNSKSTSTKACMLSFEYWYTLDGNSWNKTQVAYLDVGYSDDKISGGKSDGGIAHVQTNPNISGNVVSDYLAVTWSGASAKSKFNYKTARNGAIVESSWQRIPGATDTYYAFLKFDTERYYQTLATLTNLYFQIKP